MKTKWIRYFVISLNFAKQDHNAAPPKTPSGTMTEAMLSKVTSKDNAQNLAKKADAAAKILGGLGPYVL